MPGRRQSNVHALSDLSALVDISIMTFARMFFPSLHPLAASLSQMVSQNPRVRAGGSGYDCRQKGVMAAIMPLVDTPGANVGSTVNARGAGALGETCPGRGTLSKPLAGLKQTWYGSILRHSFF